MQSSRMLQAKSCDDVRTINDFRLTQLRKLSGSRITYSDTPSLVSVDFRRTKLSYHQIFPVRTLQTKFLEYFRTVELFCN